MTRATDLLRLAADALDDGRDPFAEGFLIEHAVTLDEVFDLSETLATAARIHLALRRHPDWLTVLMVEAALGPTAADQAEATIALRRLTERTRNRSR